MKGAPVRRFVAGLAPLRMSLWRVIRCRWFQIVRRPSRSSPQFVALPRGRESLLSLTPRSKRKRNSLKFDSGFHWAIRSITAKCFSSSASSCPPQESYRPVGRLMWPGKRSLGQALRFSSFTSPSNFSLLHGSVCAARKITTSRHCSLFSPFKERQGILLAK